MRRAHVLVLGLSAGCALDNDFPKVSTGEFLCPGLDAIGPYKSADCLECLRNRCCDEFKGCSGEPSCAQGLSEVLSPSMAPPEGDLFPSTLECMQTRCDVQCNVSFGCEGTGYANTLPRDANGLYTASLNVRTFGQPRLTSSVVVKPCNPATNSCVPAADDPAPSTEGELDLGMDSREPPYFSLIDPAYSPSSSDSQPLNHPPHVLAFSEPVPLMGARTDAEVFNTRLVQYLVVTAKKSYSPSASHVVFYLHNCLPAAYFAQSYPPNAGVEGAVVSLSSNGVELDSADVLYRTAANYLPGKSTALGAGGSANVDSGLWTATATVQREGESAPHTLSGDFQVPAGGVGVVHLYPTSRPGG